MGWTTFCGWLPSPQQSDSSFMLPLLPAVERDEKMPFSNLCCQGQALWHYLVLLSLLIFIGIVDCHYKTRTHTYVYIYIYESGLWIPSLSFYLFAWDSVISSIFQHRCLVCDVSSFASQPAEKVSAVASGPLPWRFPTGRNAIWRLGCSRSGHRFRVLETHGEK